MPAPTFAPGVLTSTDLDALAQYVDDVRTGILARGRRSSGSSTTTTEVGVLRVDDVPIRANHLIKVWTSPIFVHSTVSTDVVAALVRYTTDGSTPTTSSTALGRVQIQIGNTSFPPAIVFQLFYVPASDQTFSALLTVSRITGSGTVDLVNTAGLDLDLCIEDCGIDTGDVGVDV
jgi:hypothetical protein